MQLFNFGPSHPAQESKSPYFTVPRFLRFLASSTTSRSTIQLLYTPFRSSRCHLVSGAKSHVCSVNPINLVLYPLVSGASSTCNLVPHMFVCFSLLDPWFIIKTKVIVQIGWEKIFHMKLYDQTPTVKYKSLTVKVKTKYILTNWFSDHHF